LLRLLCFSLFLILLGCTTIHSYWSKPHNVSACQQVCLRHLAYCNQQCKDSCPDCSCGATQCASLNYKQYIHEIQVQGGEVMRQLQSYRDPLKCRKVTCNCSSDFNTCNQSCTGVVQKRLQPSPYCP
jgi:hypothetical protein